MLYTIVECFPSGKVIMKCFVYSGPKSIWTLPLHLQMYEFHYIRKQLEKIYPCAIYFSSKTLFKQEIIIFIGNT